MSELQEVKSREKTAKNWYLPVWTTLGWRAFLQSFLCGRFGCVGGARDFFWLTLLLAMVISMALLLLGSRTGLMGQFTDALLGTLRPYGVPISVTSHWKNDEGIRTPFLEQLRHVEGGIPGESYGISAHPYRHLTTNNPRVRLPTNGIWDSKMPWVGWAVYPDDPLWQLGVPQDWTREHGKADWLGLPFSVVLNESLFAQWFDYAAYQKVMQPILAQEQRQPLPAQVLQGDLKSVLSTLWLKVTVGDQEKLVPFVVRWVHHIPGIENVAYLFPLATYHALLAAHHLPELRFNPIDQGQADSALHRLLIGPTYPKAPIAAYARCIQRAVAMTGLTDLPDISEKICPKPDLRAAYFPLDKDVGKENQRSEHPVEEWDTLDHDSRNYVWLPCHRLPQNTTLRNTLCPNGAEGKSLFVPWDVNDFGSPFKAMRVYVPDSTKLNRSVKALLALRTHEGRPILDIPPLYRDALNRFNLLSDLLTTMGPVYILTFGLFLSFLLLAQVGALVGHRRHHYGILLGRGFTAVGIYAKLTLQMALITLSGGIVAFVVIIPGLRIVLEDGFRDVLARSYDLLPPGYNFEVLPLPWQSVATVIGAIYAAVILVTLFLLFQLPLRSHTTPSDLLHGDVRTLRSRVRVQADAPEIPQKAVEGLQP